MLFSQGPGLTEKRSDVLNNGSDDIRQLGELFGSGRTSYQLSFSDSVKFTHSYIKHGKPLGVVTFVNKAYPNCKLKYFVISYVNRDSIAKDLFKIECLREGSYFEGPYVSAFYTNDHVFFTGGWGTNDLATMDDRIKYMSIRIAERVALNLKHFRNK